MGPLTLASGPLFFCERGARSLMRVYKSSGSAAFNSIGGMRCCTLTHAERGSIFVGSRGTGQLPCKGSDATNDSSYRSIRTFSTSFSNTACRADTRSSDTLSSSTEPTSDGRQFIWRTVSYSCMCAFCLSVSLPAQRVSQIPTFCDTSITPCSSNLCDSRKFSHHEGLAHFSRMTRTTIAAGQQHRRGGASAPRVRIRR